jgi:multidrug efflux pump subunit AcrA (membrane-fusion protein)
MGADSSVGWGDGRNPNKLRCHCVGVRKLTPTYLCSIKVMSPLQLNYPQVAQAKARLKAARAELHRAELDLKRTRISVPFNGRVKEKFVGAGQFVTRGELRNVLTMS